MEQPLVSVLMTAYNREKYIKEAIESVLASTYTNFELIIVDDCSKDNTLEIARQYEKQDTRVKVYLNVKNLGDYPNRNKAATYAKGKYIKYLDSDDSIYFYGLEMLVRSMEAYPDAAAGLLYINIAENIPFPIKVTPQEAYRAFFFRDTLLTAGPSATIYRRDIFEKLGGYSNKNYIGDTEFHLKLAALYPIVGEQLGFFYYRVHEGQQYTEGILNDSYFRLKYKVFTESIHNPSCPLTLMEIIYIQKKIDHQYGRAIIKTFLNGKFKKAHNYYCEF